MPVSSARVLSSDPSPKGPLQGDKLGNVAHSSATLPEVAAKSRLRHEHFPSQFLGVLVFTVLGFLVMGYHPGLEDDGVYLTAVKAELNPVLFAHGESFFRLQMEATLFDWAMAHFVQWTRVPVEWAELLWQLGSLFTILWAAKRIANRLFVEEYARWAGVAMVAAMFTLPVAGTALLMADQHLHPRTMATAIILLAVERILSGRRRPAALLLGTALVLHPLMAAMGISFCLFLLMTFSDALRAKHRARSSSPAIVMPLGWAFEPAGPAWRKALDTRRYLWLYKWTWYQWAGALIPLFFFWAIWRRARSRGEFVLERFAVAVFVYGVFQQVVAMALLGCAPLVRLAPFQPMRYLHLVYLFLVLVCGCFLGKLVLQRNVWRWAAFLVAANGCMFAWQRMEFSASPQLELPGLEPANPWLQAFAWIRTNTPVDAYFALDPQYMEAPGEDYHSFRALAERSQMADAVKDPSVVTMVPELGSVWDRQVTAETGWTRFRLADFERLKTNFGADWALVSYPPPDGLGCRWHDRKLAVCRIP